MINENPETETETPPRVPCMRTLAVEDALGVAVDALAQTVQSQAATICQLTAPAPDVIGPLLASLMPLAAQLLQRYADPPPIQAHAEGLRERLVHAEYHAELAQLEREHAAARARLVADFGPRFHDARKGDDADRAQGRMTVQDMIARHDAARANGTGGPNGAAS